MNEAAIMARLHTVFEDVFDEEIAVTPDLAIGDFDAWDSIAHINLATAIEEAFAIRLTADEIANMHDVGAIAGIIGQKAARQTA